MSNAASALRDGYATGRDAIELRQYFCQEESRIGFSSTFGAMLAALEGASAGGGNSDHDSAMLTVVGFGRRTTSGTMVWRALKVLDRQQDVRSLITLHRLYGAVRVPTGYHAAFGPDVAQLASLTDAAEGAREDLAFARGDERASGIRLRCLSWRDESGDQLQRDFWAAARSEAKALAKGQSVEAQAWRDLQERILAIAMTGRDAVVSAEVSGLAGADRETGVDEAIQRRLEERDTPARAGFIAAVKREAAALKAAAHQAYSLARVSNR